MNIAQRYTKPCSVRNEILVEKSRPSYQRPVRDVTLKIAYLRYAVMCGKIVFYQYQIPNGIKNKNNYNSAIYKIIYR